ncbi:TATA-binding protein-associated factor 172-like [Ornithodoros turicata]|uniref:TATA-binding protein-associated factor 172-like n=1 Tax=Ornithodoros turicata TaxID=34597 RepID=UPI00313927C2
MTSRLDRLFLLLDTGSSPVTRKAAALQLGEVQKLHPHELHNLLAKIRKYLHSTNWDTRIAAGQAVEAIISNVPQWDPPGTPKTEDGSIGTSGSTSAHRMRFELFNINTVMKHGGYLLASEGKEFDLEDSDGGFNSKENLVKQRQQLNQRLGLDAAEKIGIDTSEIFSANDLCSVGPATSGENGNTALQDKRTLSEVFQYQLLSQQQAQAKVAPSAGPVAKRRGSNTETIANKRVKLAGGGNGATLKTEPHSSDTTAQLWDMSCEETWPLEGFMEALAQDLFSASWEVRHGAATGIREVVRLHGRGGGKVATMPAAEMEAANQLFLEDIALRLLCVLALDKFGDFISDQVVAPVRETCAQALGHILHLMAGTGDSRHPIAGGVGGVLCVLLQLLQRPEWEARHGGLLGIKYLLAVRKDLTSNLIPVVFEPVFGGLQDHNDDVSAVAAAALVPVTDDLVRIMPNEVPRVIGTLWDSLLDLDDLTSSTSSILTLLASLLSYSLVQASNQDPSHIVQLAQSHPLQSCVPRLWPFLGHNAAIVRKSVLESLLILTSKSSPQPPDEWLPAVLSDLLRLLFQHCLIESNTDVLCLIFRVWQQVLEGAPLDAILISACPYLSSWLCLLMHPSHLAIDPSALQWLVLPPRTKHDKKVVGRRSLCEGPREIGAATTVAQFYIGGAESLNESPQEREALVLRCRYMASKLLGVLSGYVTQPMPGTHLEAATTDATESPVECYARLVLFHLRSKSALQRMATALVLAHWVALDPKHTCPVSVRERVLECLSENIYFDEIASAFTRLQQECRDFTALLRHFQLPLDASYQPSVVLTVDQATQLATSVFQSLVQQTKLKPKVLENLEEKRKCVLRTAMQTGKDQLSLNIMVQASLASFLVSLHWLPEKLNPVIRPLMESIKKEENEQLQRASAEHLVLLLEQCVQRQPCPNPKVLRNLIAFLCSDASFTPRIESGPTESNAEEATQRQQRQNSVATATTLLHTPSKFDGILTLANMQKSAERAGLRRANSVAARKNSLQGTPPTDGATEDTQCLADDETQHANEIQRRGATIALSYAASYLGENLPEKLPSLWEIAFEALRQNGKHVAGENTIDSTARNQDELSQQLVTGLQLLEVVGPNLHLQLHSKVAEVLPALCVTLDHSHTAVRHMAARCLGMLSKVLTVPTMTLILGEVLGRIGASHADTQRQGAIEAIACVIDNLGLDLVPYIVFLVVPMLGRMSDNNEAVRLLATHCFAALVRLMPLDGGIHEPLNLPAHLEAKRIEEKHFLEQLMNAKHADNFQLSIPISAQLRSYQQEGVNWLAFLNKYKLHGILCDDMGLGKTLQSICILAQDHFLREQAYKESGQPDSKPLPSLVICPPTLTGHWVYEVEKFVSSKYLNPLHYTGPPTERMKLQGRARRHNLIVASYDIVRNDIDFFGAIRWNYCILDEGHIIKNGRTKLARAIKQLRANHRLILTGTPIQNNVLDLWSLFDFLMPGFLGTERQFVSRYSRPILQSRDAKSSSKEQEAGVLAMESLHRQVLPFLLRRMKDDVLQDLPPKIIQDYYCELSPLQVQLYEDFAKSRAKKAVDDSVVGASNENVDMHGTCHVFQALQYLRKVCNHPKLVLNTYHPEYERIMRSLQQSNTPLSDIGHAAKLRSLKQLLLDCGIGTAGQAEQEQVVHAHRALIFCQLKSMLDIVEKDLLKMHMSSVSYLRLDGSVPPGQRHALVQRFNDDPSIDVLLLTTQVGGLGLNLTGADTVIFVEHDWNPMKDLQAMDRAHRIGQKKVVNVYRLITRGTLEEKIMGLQKFKLTIANTVITQENSSLQTMGTDQLLDLFTLDQDGAKTTDRAGSSSTRSIRGLLETLPELWDSSKYDSEYDLSCFLSTLKPK